MCFRLLSVGVGCSMLAAQASAATVTYHAQGTIDYKVTAGSVFPAALSSVGQGDTFEISVTFDTTAAADTSVANTNRGDYAMPIGTYSAQLRLGSASATLSSSGPLSIQVTNNFNGMDIVELLLGDDTPGNGFFTTDDVIFSVVLPGSTFSTDVIPTSIVGAPLSSSSLTYNSYLNLNPFFPSASFMGGTITSFEIVPAPAGLGLLSIGGLAAGVRRRR